MCSIRRGGEPRRRQLLIRPGAVLDEGCGPGHLTAYLRSLDVDAFGIDLVTEFIDHARRAYPGGRYELGSMQRLPVPDGSLAGILEWYSLIHVSPDQIDGVLVGRAMLVGSASGPQFSECLADVGSAQHSSSVPAATAR